MASLLAKVIMPLPLQQGGSSGGGGDGGGHVDNDNGDVPVQLPASTSLDQGELLNHAIRKQQKQENSRHHHPKRALSVPTFSSIEVLFGSNSSNHGNNNANEDDEINNASTGEQNDNTSIPKTPMDQAAMLEKTILEQKQQYEKKFTTSFKEYLFGSTTSTSTSSSSSAWRALPGASLGFASFSLSNSYEEKEQVVANQKPKTAPSSPIRNKKPTTKSIPASPVRLHDDENEMVHDYNHQFKAFKRRFQTFYSSLSPRTSSGDDDDDDGKMTVSSSNSMGLHNADKLVDIASIPSLSTTSTTRRHTTGHNNNKSSKQQTYQVLFLSADTGGGHRASAESLGKQIQLQYPGSSYQLLDTFQSEQIPIYKTLCDNYGDMTKNPWQWRIVYHTSNGAIAGELFKQHLLYLSLQKIKRRIAQLDPDFIICVHPGMVFNHLYAAKELSKEQNRPIPFFVVITDLGSGHRSWFEPGVSKIYLASDWMNMMAIKIGIASSKIVRSGLPIRHNFALQAEQLLNGEGGTNNRTSLKAQQYQQSIRKLLQLPPKSQTVLLMAGGEGQGSALEEIATYLYLALKSQNLHATILVVCGKNADLKEKLTLKDWDLTAAELQNSMNEIDNKKNQKLLDSSTTSPRGTATALSVITRIKKELEELRADSSTSPAAVSPLAMINSGDQNIFDDESSQSRRNYLRKHHRPSPTNSSSSSPRSSTSNNDDTSPTKNNDGGGDNEDVASSPTLSPSTKDKNDEDITTKGNDEKATTNSSNDDVDDDDQDTESDEEEEEEKANMPESLESIASIIGNGSATNVSPESLESVASIFGNKNDSSNPSSSATTTSSSVSSSSAKVKVVPLGFVTKMAEYMVAADILVSKAGPGTIAEAAALGLPMLLTSFLPGQEAGNVDFVVDGKFGIFEQNSKEIANIVTSWLTNPDKLAELSSNACKAGKPYAAQEIIKDIGSTVHTIFGNAVKTSHQETN